MTKLPPELVLATFVDDILPYFDPEQQRALKLAVKRLHNKEIDPRGFPEEIKSVSRSDETLGLFFQTLAVIDQARAPDGTVPYDDNLIRGFQAGRQNILQELQRKKSHLEERQNKKARRKEREERKRIPQKKKEEEEETKQAEEPAPPEKEVEEPKKPEGDTFYRYHATMNPKNFISVPGGLIRESSFNRRLLAVLQSSGLLLRPDTRYFLSEALRDWLKDVLEQMYQIAMFRRSGGEEEKEASSMGAVVDRSSIPCTLQVRDFDYLLDTQPFRFSSRASSLSSVKLDFTELFPSPTELMEELDPS